MTPLIKAAVVIGLGAAAVSGNTIKFITTHTAAPNSSPRSAHCVRNTTMRRLAGLRTLQIMMNAGGGSSTFLLMMSFSGLKAYQSASSTIAARIRIKTRYRRNIRFPFLAEESLAW